MTATSEGVESLNFLQDADGNTQIFNSRHVSLVLPKGGKVLDVVVKRPRWWQLNHPVIFEYQVVTPPTDESEQVVYLQPIDFDTPTGDPMVIHRRVFYP